MLTTPREFVPVATIKKNEKQRQGSDETIIYTRPHSASPQRDVGCQLIEEKQTAAEEAVTLSSVSSTISSPSDDPLLPSPQCLRHDATTTTSSATAAEINPAVVKNPLGSILPQCNEDKKDDKNCNGTGAPNNDNQWNKQISRYLEAARLLREMNDGIEKREQFLQNEIQSQKNIYSEKKAELDKKKELHQSMQASALHLTRQVRSLDCENDRMRDRLAQLEAATNKALLVRAPRRVSGNVCLSQAPPHSSHKSTKKQDTAWTSAHGSSFSAPPPAACGLAAELSACRKKLRLVEEKHKELLTEVKLAMARKKGRIAAYKSAPSNLALNEYPLASGGEHSFSRNTPDVAAVIQRLERLIDNSLVGS